ncbi:hypothetical protein [Alkalibacillus flavidus]
MTLSDTAIFGHDTAKSSGYTATFLIDTAIFIHYTAKSTSHTAKHKKSR